MCCWARRRVRGRWQEQAVDDGLDQQNIYIVSKGEATRRMSSGWRGGAGRAGGPAGGRGLSWWAGGQAGWRGWAGGRAGSAGAFERPRRVGAGPGDSDRQGEVDGRGRKGRRHLSPVSTEGGRAGRGRVVSRGSDL
jgi:hypothetical protein